MFLKNAYLFKPISLNGGDGFCPKLGNYCGWNFSC